ncbi:MAG: hypothetical protein GXX83_02620 [Gaiellales bacterium]|nr:hypothetical protein [Gaiellales bacterium]
MAGLGDAALQAGEGRGRGLLAFYGLPILLGRLTWLSAQLGRFRFFEL